MSYESYFKNSLVEKEFMRLLANPEIKVVSFDIFDTLFFRKCTSAADLFEMVGADEMPRAIFDTPNSFMHYRKNAENSAKRAHPDKQEISFDDIYMQLPLSQEQRKVIQKLELEREREELFVNPQLERWISLATAAGKKVILTSDMYLSLEQIEFVALHKLTNKEQIKKVFVSSECNATKANGKLFLHLLAELGISKSELLHIGDNEHSDISVAKNLEIHTLYYGADKAQKRRYKHELLYMQESIDDAKRARMLSSLQNPYEDELKRFYFDIGVSLFAPLLWEFSHWVAQMHQRHKREKLLFLMREGALFERCFKMLYPEIETSLLYVSRRSTYFLTLDAQDIGSINFAMHKNLTLKELYANFFIEPKNPLLVEHMERSCDKIVSIFIDETSLLTLVQEDFKQQKESIEQQLQTQRELLIEYLQAPNINAKSALVDFGGGGTVIRRLCGVLQEEQSPETNLLLFQHPQAYSSLLGLHTLSFLPLSKKTAAPLTALQQTPAFVEILLNATHPTTQCYERELHTVVPQTFLPETNRQNIADITDAFTSGIELFFAFAKASALPPQSYDRESLALLLCRVIELPTPQESQFLGALEYDEGKASEHFYKLVETKHLEILQEQTLEKAYREFLSNPTKYKEKFPWMQGAITQLSSELICSFYKADTNPNQEAIESILEKLDASGEKRVMIYGAGELFVQLLPHLRERNIEIEAVIDSRAEVGSFYKEGYEVVSLAEALKEKEDVIVVIASGVYKETIEKTIKNFMHQNSIKVTII